MRQSVMRSLFRSVVVMIEGNLELIGSRHSGSCRGNQAVDRLLGKLDMLSLPMGMTRLCLCDLEGAVHVTWFKRKFS